MNVLTLGSTGLVGSRLLARLLVEGHGVTAVTRQNREAQSGVTWLQADATDSNQLERLPSTEVLVSSVSIETTAAVARHLAPQGLRRVIAFSSTSAITKADAASPAERELSQLLLGGERALASLSDVETTILRPTMIYGGPGDRNVERIAAFLTRLPVFPLVGGGRGRRQPVHAEDLAQVAMQALASSSTGTYTVSGGETLTVRELVERTAQANGITARFISVPRGVAVAGARVASRVPGVGKVPPGAIDRMTKDLVFDHSAASADLGYRPRNFSPPNYRLAITS